MSSLPQRHSPAGDKYHGNVLQADECLSKSQGPQEWLWRGIAPSVLLLYAPQCCSLFSDFLLPSPFSFLLPPFFPNSSYLFKSPLPSVHPPSLLAVSPAVSICFAFSWLLFYPLCSCQIPFRFPSPPKHVPPCSPSLASFCPRSFFLPITPPFFFSSLPNLLFLL